MRIRAKETALYGKYDCGVNKMACNTKLFLCRSRRRMAQ